MALSLGITGLVRAQDAADPDLGTVDYLGLGDSIPFGDNQFIPYNLENRPDFSAFVGYPDYVGNWYFGGRYRNLGCPGETTASFLDYTQPSLGCEKYKAILPLKTVYTGSQIDKAEELIAKNPQMKLISLTLIGNDYFLLLQKCTAENEGNPDALEQCLIQGALGTISTAVKNLKVIVSRLKAAGFKGKIVVSTLYTNDLRDTSRALIIGAGNVALSAAVISEGARVVDFFARAAADEVKVGGNGCETNLFIPNPISPVPEGALECDYHPAPAGAQAFAQLVWWRYKQWF